ncbi:MAG: rod shape-determining protein [Clostridia bacterium]|nr:rod shape-determining protein [Clostridia bacterium]
MSKRDIGIDLGTANTLIYIKTKGIILNEPSVIAVASDADNILAVGKAAKVMLERTPLGVRAVRPVMRGSVSDYKSASAMLSRFIKKIIKHGFSSKPRALVCVPAGITDVEKRAVSEVVSSSGIRKHFLIEEPMAAAIGAGLDVNAASGCMVVDIGGGTTEVAVISLGGIVTHKSVRCGGDSFNVAINNYIRKKYNVLAGTHSIENIKIEIATVMDGDASHRCQISGRSSVSGMPCSCFVTGEDVKNAIMPEVHIILEAVKSVIEETPPELCADILKSSVVLTGGGALINGMDRLICDCTGMPVVIADSPLECVALGLGKIIDNKTLNKKFFS